MPKKRWSWQSPLSSFKDIINRKEQILELITKGYNSVKTLAEHFGVSLMTIYRDVRKLEKELQGSEVQSCMTRDFISGNPINCFSAWYVIDSSAVPCCSPSAIAFGNKEDAEKFAKGFGGKVFDFESAVRVVEELMKRGQRVIWEVRSS